jgi:enoyl-[acyl-carrier protein] reductase II
MIRTRITDIFGIEYPIVQGGMIWVAGGKLAAAVSEAGGLGLVGAGSMEPELFRGQIRKVREHTRNPFGVNIPLQYRHSAECIEIALEEEVKIIFTSAGSPKGSTPRFKSEGRIVVHVAPNARLAAKCEAAGCDAVVVEGTEAGGHNSREEITTFCLLPQARDRVQIPLIAAGGIADGRGLAAALALGADGVQVGTRFAATVESSASRAYKEAVVNAEENATRLLLKKLVPTRMIMNDFARKVQEAEARGADPGELLAMLGEGRARQGIFEDDIGEGEIEAGQVSGLIREIVSAGEVIRRMVREYEEVKARLP